MEARTPGWDRVRLKTVGVIKIYPDHEPSEGPDAIKQALLVADQKNPWKSSEIADLPSIGSVGGPTWEEATLGRISLRWLKLSIRPSVLLRPTQLGAYHRYLMQLAENMANVETPRMSLVTAELQTETFSRGFFPGRAKWSLPEEPHVLLCVEAKTTDGNYVPTQGRLRELLKGCPSDIVFHVMEYEPFLPNPKEPERQVEIVGRPIDELTSMPFTGDMLPQDVVLHVIGPDYYSPSGRRKYNCFVWRTQRNSLHVG